MTRGAFLVNSQILSNVLYINVIKSYMHVAKTGAWKFPALWMEPRSQKYEALQIRSAQLQEAKMLKESFHNKMSKGSLCETECIHIKL